MKIKLALLDSDQNYLNRIVTAFNIKYADKLEIYSFTKLESAMAALEPSRIDVLVASDTFVVESSALPKRCQLAYFVESADVDSVNDQRAICKFQKADLIYRQILSIYSEYAGSASGWGMIPARSSLSRLPAEVLAAPPWRRPAPCTMPPVESGRCI